MANNPTLLTRPLAEHGQKNTIPDTTDGSTGLFSQQYGWQSINSLPLQAGGKAVKREDFNGAFNLLGGIAFYAQKGYHFLYDVTQDYFVGCVVIDPTDGKMYICHTDMAVADTVAPHLDTNENYWRLYNPINECYRQPSTTYAAGAIKYHASLPTGYYLECTTAGTTGSGALSIGGGTVGSTISDGTVTWTVRRYALDFPRYGAFNKAETFTSSGTFTAPVSGTYRITLQGGGGGGGGAGTDARSIHHAGGQGGQGGHYEFYEKLTAGTSYSFTVGGGGSGGTAGSSASGATGAAGAPGGNTIITINGNKYAATGGSSEHTSVYSGSWGGQAGYGTKNNVTVAGTSGCAGSSGGQTAGYHLFNGFASGFGGGLGGSGGSIDYNGGYNAGGAGGDGYIKFEYCDV